MDSNHAVVLLAPGCLRGLSCLNSRSMKSAASNAPAAVYSSSSEEDALPFRVKIEPISSAHPEPVLFIHQKLYRTSVPQANPHQIYPTEGMPAFQFIDHALHNLILLPFTTAQQMIGVQHSKQAD